jgi:hypothetical protein
VYNTSEYSSRVIVEQTKLAFKFLEVIAYIYVEVFKHGYKSGGESQGGDYGRITGKTPW